MLCELTDQEGNTRLVEPYMIFDSTRGKRQFHCFQVEGHSSSNHHFSWKNLDVSDVVSVTPTGTRFQIRASYNPGNRRNFPVVHFAIPKTMSASG